MLNSLSKKIAPFLRNLFHLHKGEEFNAILFTSLAFLWSFAASSIVTVSISMFIANVGASHLPSVYIWNACFQFLLALIQIYLMRHFSLSFLFQGQLALGGFAFLTCSFLFLEREHGHASDFLWFVVATFSTMFLIVIKNGFWNFIDQFHTLNQAKRFYSLPNAAIILGLALGGGLFIQYGFSILQVKGVFFVSTLLILCAFLLSIFIQSKIDVLRDDNLEQQPGIDKVSVKDTFFSILRSPFTLFFIADCLFVQFTEQITEFSYLDTFQKSFGMSPDTSLIVGNENPLTSFLGKVKGWTYLGALVVGGFFFSRMIKKFGVDLFIPTFEICYLAVFILWMFTDSLEIAILGLIVTEGISYSIDDNFQNLLLRAVPNKTQSTLRILTASFFEPIGMLIAGGLLALSLNSKILGLICSAASVVAVMFVRHYYSQAIFKNLIDNALHFEKNSLETINNLPSKQKKNFTKKFLEDFSNYPSSSQLLICELFIKIADETDLVHLVNLASNTFDNTNKEKLLLLLENTEFSATEAILESLDKWKELPGCSLQLQQRIHLYLAKLGLLHPNKVLADLESPYPLIKGAAILVLRHSVANINTQELMSHHTLAQKHLQQLLDSPEEPDVCLGLQILCLERQSIPITTLLPYLKNSSLSIARHGAKVLACTAAPNQKNLTTSLIEIFSSRKDSLFRLDCLQALSKTFSSTYTIDLLLACEHILPKERRFVEKILFNQGRKAVPHLLSFTIKPSYSPQLRLISCRVLGRLAPHLVRQHLHEIISKEVEKGLFYYYHFHTLEDSSLKENLNLLKSTLLSGFHNTIDFLIQLLGITGSVEDSEVLLRSLKSVYSKVHSQAIETLEKSCDPKIFQLLEILLDLHPNLEKLKSITSQELTSQGTFEILQVLSSSPLVVDRVTAATITSSLKLPQWKESLKNNMIESEEVYYQFGYEILNYE
jgi:hypothetical protein